jgi:dihydroflavonol-4-reductase
VAALGLTRDGSPADETTPVQPSHLIGAYKRSKYDAEQAVRALAAEQDIVIVNPSTPVGPGDVKPTPTGKMVLDAANGRMPAFVDTGLNIVHVDDCAAGHVLAMQRGRRGEAYILGGDDLMLGEFFALIARQARRKPPKIRLPIAPLVPIAWVMERIAGVTGKTPLMTTEMLKMAHKKMFFRSGKAIRELGYAPRPAAAAIAGALDYFTARGLIR